MKRLLLRLLLVGCFGYLALSTHAQTNVSGTIAANTTWTFANTPYFVVGDVTIAPGVQLDIEPGVEVRFYPNTQLAIEGNIQAIGNDTMPVTFRGVYADSTWGGIHFLAECSYDSLSNVGSVFRSCRILGGLPTNPSPVGLSFDTECFPMIHSSEVKNFVTLIDSIEGQGIFRRNVFKNGKIILAQRSTIKRHGMIIHENEFVNAPLEVASQAQFSFNCFDATPMTIDYGATKDSLEARIINNLFKNNSGAYALSLRADTGRLHIVTATQNLFLNNNTDIFFACEQADFVSIGFNNFLTIDSNDIVGSDINCPTPLGDSIIIDINNNYWDGADSAAIEAAIKDFRDDQNIALRFDFIPVQATPVVIDTSNLCGRQLFNLCNLEGCVWPGDANNDGVANNLDILSIGLSYGRTGPPRDSLTINWNAYYSEPWLDSIPGTNLDNKYADCNGDGIIEDADITAILQHYNLTHNKTTPGSRAGAHELEVIIPMDSVHPGDTVPFSVHLGDSLDPAAIYGMAFQFGYDPTVVKTNSMQLNYANSWLATDSDTISLFYQGSTGTIAHLGFSRTDHTNKEGFGPVVQGIIVIEDNLDEHTVIVGILEPVLLALDSLGTVDTLSITTIPDSVLVVKKDSSDTSNISAPLPQQEDQIILFPNPADQVLLIKTNQSILKGIEVKDLTGQRMLQQNIAPSTHANVDLKSLSQGIYFVTIHTDWGKVVKKLVVVH